MMNQAESLQNGPPQMHDEDEVRFSLILTEISSILLLDQIAGQTT
jgi:hypothetical protein